MLAPGEVFFSMIQLDYAGYHTGVEDMGGSSKIDGGLEKIHGGSMGV